MAKTNINSIFVFGLAIGIGFYLLKPKPKTLILTIKGVPSNPPPQVKPAPKSTSPKKLPEETPKEEDKGLIKLYENQYIKRLPSQIMNDNEEAPLILVIPPRYMQSNSNFYYQENKDILDIFPKDLNARVFLFISNTNYTYLEEAANVGKVLISGLKELRAAYPTNKVIVFGFGDGALVAFYLAASDAINSTYIYGSYGNYNYQMKYPGSTKLFAWLPNNAVGDEFYKISQPIYTLYKAFEQFNKAGFPQTLFLKGSGEQKVTPGELELAAQKMLSLKGYIPYVDNPGFKIEYDGNLDQCAIILGINEIDEATWALTSTAVGIAQYNNKAVTPQEFWQIVNGFFGQIDSKCMTIERYWDTPLSAQYGYWVFRGAIRALVNQGFMKAEDAITTLSQAKSEAIENGVADNPALFPGLKNYFEP